MKKIVDVFFSDEEKPAPRVIDTSKQSVLPNTLLSEEEVPACLQKASGRNAVVALKGERASLWLRNRELLGQLDEENRNPSETLQILKVLSVYFHMSFILTSTVE